MSQRYNDKTKRPKPKENQLEILKIYAFCQKIQQRALAPAESAAGVTIYLWEYTRKVAASSPLNVDATLLRDSWKGAAGVS